MLCQMSAVVTAEEGHMNRIRRIRITSLGLGVLFILLLAVTTWAGSSDNYAIDWSVMSGGGAPAASGSGNVALNGSLGQTAIGPSASTGGEYALGAGYWLEEEPAPYFYLPVVLRYWSEPAPYIYLPVVLRGS
jgi:hypothetical protein